MDSRGDSSTKYPADGQQTGRTAGHNFAECFSFIGGYLTAKGGEKMAFEQVFSNDEFSVFYVGRHETDGGFLFMIEPNAVAVQGNALLIELPTDAATAAPGGFAINFDYRRPVYQGDADDEGDADAIEIHYSDADAGRIELDRVADADGLFINPATGAAWMKARVYMLDKSRRVVNSRVVGYVPLTAITRFEIGQNELIKCNLHATD